MFGSNYAQPTDKKALTLVELAVVLGLGGLLMLMGVWGFQSVQATARRAQALAELSEYALELEAEKLKTGEYPFVMPSQGPDPWGSLYIYLPEAAGFTLKSLGPDGVNSDDDIYFYQK